MHTSVERIHRVVGDMLRTHYFKNHDFDEVDSWGSILEEITRAVRSIITQQIKPLLGNQFLVEICYLISNIFQIGKT